MIYSNKHLKKTCFNWFTQKKKHQLLLLKTLLSAFVLLASAQMNAQALLQWNTFGNAGTETTEPSTFNHAKISAANLTIGTITAAANGNRFGGSNWFNTGNSNPNTLANAISGNDYIQFVVTPTSGNSFTPTSFVFTWDRSSTGPSSVTLRSSNDGFAADLGTVTGLTSGGSATTTVRTISISGLSNITAATTFRLYGYGATATSGTGGFDNATNVVDVQLNGTAVSLNAPTASVISGGGTICAGSTSSLSVAITGGTSPYTLVYGDGTNSFTVNSYLSGTAISVSPSTTSTYTITSVTDANGEPGAGNSGSALVTVNQPTPNSATGTYSDSKTQADGTTVTYKSSCDLIGSITDASGGNVLGSTIFEANVASTNPVGSQYNYMYCKKTFTVVPTSNGAGTIVLNMSNAEFVDFNTNKPSWMTPLPVTSNSTDISNIRVTRVNGSTHTNIFLSASNFSWNAAGYWQLSINVSSIEGTYYVTSTPDCTNEEVTGLTLGTLTANSAPLSWNAISGYGWFVVEYKTTASGTWTNSVIAQVGTTSTTIGGLLSGISYDFRIARRCSPTSIGNWSTPVFGTTVLPCSVAPSNITMTNTTATSTTVNWSTVSGFGWYGVRYKLSSGSTWNTLTTGNTNYTINGLLPNTSYDIQVKTFCNNNNPGLSSAWSTTNSIMTSNVPCSFPPSSVTVPSTSSTTSNISWTNVTGFSWYGVRYKLLSASTWSTLTSTTNSILLNGLTANSNYEVQVKTFCPNSNTGLSSVWSASVQFTTQAASLSCTNAPSNLTVSAITANNVNLNWDANSVGLGWYGIQFKTIASSTWSTLTASSNLKTLTGLTANTDYEVQVKTFCNNNNPGLSSAWSTSTNFKTGASAKLNYAQTNTNPVVYPNPTSDELNIEFTVENESNTVLKVMDMSGRVVKQIQSNSIIGQNKLTVNLKELTAGLYTIQLYSNDKLQFVNRISKN